MDVVVAVGSEVGVADACMVGTGELVSDNTVAGVGAEPQPKAKSKSICQRKRAGLQIRKSIFALLIFFPLINKELNSIVLLSA